MKETKHYLAHLSTIGFCCGIVKSLKRIKRSEHILSNTIAEKLDRAWNAGTNAAGSFPAILSPKGEKVCTKRSFDFQKNHMKAISDRALIYLACMLIETLAEKRKPNGGDIFSSEQKKALDIFCKRIFAVLQYMDRNLMDREACQEAKELAEKWWYCMYK